MPQPYNYSINLKDPFEEAVKGMKFGATVADVQAARQQAAIEAQRQAMLEQAMLELANKQNPSAKDFTNIAMFLPKDQAEGMRKNWELLSKDQQQNDLKFGGQILSAFSSNAPDVGINLLKQRAEAERNAGREDFAKAYETYAQVAEVDPGYAQKSIGIMLASLPGGDKTIESAIKAQTAPSEIAKEQAIALQEGQKAASMGDKLALENEKLAADVRNINDQINERAKRLALDNDKLRSDLQMKLAEFGNKSANLDVNSRKLITESALSSVAAEQASAKSFDLAKRIEAKGDGMFGLAGRAKESLADLTGNQDEWSQLRQEYTRLRNAAAIKSLPPGPATDKDISLALKGFPGEVADASTIASFLRGMGKMQALDAVVASSQSDWLAANGHLGRAKEDLEISGVKVSAGSTFTDFVREFSKQKAESLIAPKAQEVISTRSYMRYATKPMQGQ